MVVDCRRTYKQPGGHFTVRLATGNEICDLGLPRAQLYGRFGRASEGLLTGSRQLDAGTLGETPGPHVGEHVVSNGQLYPRILTPTLPTKPLSKYQVAAGKHSGSVGASKQVNRMPVMRLGVYVICQKRSTDG